MASSDLPSHEEAQRQSSVVQADVGLASEEDAVVLAKLGYKQELRRNFSLIEVFGIAFSIMGLLPSIASTLAYSLPTGPAGMIWGWFIPCIFIFIVGLAMADLGSSMPTAGGLYWWTHYFATERAKNPLSFLAGYSNTLGLIGGLVSIDYGFSLMFLSVIVIAKDGTWHPSPGVVYAVFLGCVLVHGVLASTLSKIMGKLQTLAVVMNVILILATVIALPIGRASQRNSGKYIFTHFDNTTTWPTGWAFILAWLSSIWTIGAFDSCVHIAEEASNAEKAVPYGILLSIGSCWVFGFILVIVIAACMNPDTAALLESPFGQPMAQIYYDALGKRGALGLMSLLFIVQFLMGLSILVAASRQSWAFSRDGALPFSSFFRPISKRFGYIPVRTVWGCVVAGAVLGLLCLINSAAAQALFSLAVSGNYLAWLLPIFSRVILGQAKFKPGPFYTGKFSVLIAWTAIIFLVFGIILTMFPIGGPNPSPDTMNYAVVINVAVWGGSCLYYAIDARKWFTGPKITIEGDELGEAQKEGVISERLGKELSKNAKQRGDIKAVDDNASGTS